MKPRKKKKSPRLQKILWRIESLGFGLLMSALGCLPVNGHHYLAQPLAAIIALFRPRNTVLKENFARLENRLTEETPRPTSFWLIYHSIRLAMELARLERIRPEELAPAIENPEELEKHITPLFEKGQGCLLATGHLGNWEWFGAIISLRFGKYGAIYKPIHNPYIDKRILNIRCRFGATLFSTREKTPRGLVRHLRSGGLAAILSDQDARRQGIMVPFFGQPASTSPGLATMAIRQRCPVLFGSMVRTKRGTFRIKISEPIWPDPEAPLATEQERIMHWYHERLEEAICEAPSQYFWWHRRWKTRPRTSSPPETTRQPERA